MTILKMPVPRVAMDLVARLERAYAQIAHHPASGAPRFAYELAIPNLRHVRIKVLST